MPKCALVFGARTFVSRQGAKEGIAKNAKKKKKE
jgi:hypothetical protein